MLLRSPQASQRQAQQACCFKHKESAACSTEVLPQFAHVQAEIGPQNRQKQAVEPRPMCHRIGISATNASYMLWFGLRPFIPWLSWGSHVPS